MRQWRRVRLFAAMCLFASAFCTVGRVGMLAQQIITNNDISVDRDRQIAVRFKVLLNRDGRERTVKSNYRFEDGDQMKFQFELNKSAYVYVLHREFRSDPDPSPGIEVLRDDDLLLPEGYQLLFPKREVGRSNRLAAGKVHTIPADPDLYFTMDDRPGIEKLYVVVSDREVDITEHFDLSDGSMRLGSGGGGTDGTDDDVLSQLSAMLASYDDVLSQLSAMLASYAANAETIFDDEGISLELDNYGAGRDPKEPFMIEVDLAHHARSRRGR